MVGTTKLNKLLHTSRDEREAHDWVFSLTPISVAFVFYVIFIMSADVEQRGVFIAYGAAAGFIGLETYWIIRGWVNNHLSTIILSFVGAAVAAGLLRMYLYFI
jgi:hypothetical protein